MNKETDPRSRRVKNIGPNWREFARIAEEGEDEESFIILKSEVPLMIKFFDNYVAGRRLQGVRLADLGGGIGLLTQAITDGRKSQDIPLYCVSFDVNEKDLRDNTSAERVVAQLEELPAMDCSFDVAVMRLVLTYNDKEVQQRILNEAFRVLKPGGIFINFWAGARTKPHQKKLMEAFGMGKEASILPDDITDRQDNYEPVWEESVKMYQKTGFVIGAKGQQGVKRFSQPIKTNVQIRYNLTDEKNEFFLNFLGKYAYFEFAVFVTQKPK